MIPNYSEYYADTYIYALYDLFTFSCKTQFLPVTVAPLTHCKFLKLNFATAEIFLTVTCDLKKNFFFLSPLKYKLLFVKELFVLFFFSSVNKNNLW